MEDMRSEDKWFTIHLFVESDRVDYASCDLLPRHHENLTYRVRQKKVDP